MTAIIEQRKEQGERLRQVRAEYNKTQKEMSAYLGLGGITWQTYERGKSSPKREVYTRLARDGWNSGWIMTGVGEMKIRSPAPLYSLRETSAPEFLSGRKVNARRLFDVVFDHISEVERGRGDRDAKALADRAFDLTEQVLSIAGSDAEAAKVLQILLEREENE